MLSSLFNNNVTYNATLANILGLNAAIYLGVLMDIEHQQSLNNKDNEGFFKVNRSNITELTTFELKDQHELDKYLIDTKVLITSDNKFKIDYNQLISLAGEQITPVINTEINKRGRKSKSEIILDKVKKSVVVTNEELRAAYYDWIEAVNDKHGFVTKAMVEKAQKVIDTTTNRNLDMALEILKCASLNGYRDMEWAVNYYNQHKKQNYLNSVPASPQVQFMEEVF